MAHADILDQQDRLTGFFWGSIALHVAIVGGLVLYNTVGGGSHVQWGSKTGGGIGSVAVNTTPAIPLPRSNGPENPVANPTKSEVPTPPATKAKPAPKPAVKPAAPEPDAVTLKSRKSTPVRKKHEEALTESEPRQTASTPNRFRDTQRDAPNQLYSTSGQTLSSSMMGKPGSGQLGYGDSSPFGEQLGWYANRLRDLVSQHWNTDNIPQQIRSAPQVVVTFTLRRDGSISGVPVVKQSSGNATLDYSAQRAIVEAQPFPPIPAEYTRNQAQVDFTFELRR
ncbi:MAG TPA: TonB family protein [Verrucomicrobiae bacterium]|nr:TonB family protein [Verrucomicrobiae bacterium]